MLDALLVLLLVLGLDKRFFLRRELDHDLLLLDQLRLQRLSLQLLAVDVTLNPLEVHLLAVSLLVTLIDQV